ncbi:Predicted arabinose efflux permease, MFS family [Brevibacterium siliguriense]|uniref:Predicted arabinose efflux permease, MFS family n=1 Tax=Brevibacterium siliguriense TaxID=1136497 RepID=A0A1H1V8I0_9MICO|nr:MFS transporter [Brevibacterium siliguriense]SDS80569.1 Predicted arabinose efflux permease, MFS family [Brevibacterium siliguriense]
MATHKSGTDRRGRDTASIWLNPLRAVSSLRGNRAFQQLWLSNLFYFAGVWTQTLVLGWLAFEITHSEFLVAVYAAARLAPLLLGPLAGSLADRFNRVALLLILVGWATFAVSMVATLASLHILSYWVLVAGGLAIGLAQSPSQPARFSLVLELVGPRKLSNANALNALAMNMTQVIGPAAGGAMIALIGAPAALWVSAGWYVLSFLLIVPLRGRGSALHKGKESVIKMVVGGVKTVASDRLTLAVLLVTLAANIFLWPIFQSFMPIFAKESFGLDAAGLGALLTCAGVGGIVGSIIIAGLDDFRFKGGVFILGTMTWGGLWAVFSLMHSPASAFILMVLVGMASATFGVLQTTLILITSQPQMHGRVLGLQELAIGIMPASILLLGAAAEAIGVAATTFASSLMMILVLALVLWRVPEILYISHSEDIRHD